MNCLPCFGSKESDIKEQEDLRDAQPKGHPTSQPPVITMDTSSVPASKPNNQNHESATSNINGTNEVADNPARNFGFRELAMATKNFRRETLLDENRVGKVFKGTLQGTGQVVAVKQLDRHGTKANKEFLAEVMMLSRLRHPNLVELIGYCADGDQRILVYEYMQMGSLKNHLHEVPPEKEPLDWVTRMKIASGAAQALEYLHEKTNPPILYRTFTSPNILLDENLEPKLSDYGLVRLEIDTGNTMQQRMVSTVGCAPEYEQNGELTPKSDVYCFGVVLLELITGRKALDTTLPMDEQNLTKWAQPYFKDPKRFPEMVDPRLEGSFPDKSLNQAVGVAAMCVQDDPSVRPMISDVVAALSFLAMAPPPQPQPQKDPTTASTNDPNAENHSSCLSSSSIEAEDDDYSCSDSEDEDEQHYHMRTKHNKNSYDEDRCGTSSSESLYNEDDYWEDESHHEETSYRSKSKIKSIKRKVTFGRDKSVSRNSSKNKSLKKHSGPSLRKTSVNRISPKTHLGSNSRNKIVDRKSSKNNETDNVSLSKKTHDALEDHQSSSNSSLSPDNGESSRRDVTLESSRKNVVKSDTGMNNIEVEILDGEEGINARLLEDTYVPI
ncbi:putative protein kinase RLK-Pelle-RLCK-VIIa-1 family [Helianthus annuus]|uniref:Putative mitogen-activated protein kinase kinase kinase 12/13 n=1 Tax=Helianthus annuus TaxID=4232 RepID=A0A251TTK6_HELAN|nr:probable serine/threonine-protein kinase PBL24 [Helianthus annuus]KAF5790099.1 putative protein kinase RLK-Pelle-RLCK-VIIa-1 family [Helianthus annuus]